MIIMLWTLNIDAGDAGVFCEYKLSAEFFSWRLRVCFRKFKNKVVKNCILNVLFYFCSYLLPALAGHLSLVEYKLN